MRLAPTLLRSALVGLVATAADVGALFVLVQGFGWSAVHANLPALTLGVTLQFFGNKIFAFRDRSRDYLRQGSLFLLVESGTFVLNAIAFHLLVTLTPVPYVLARGIGTLAVYLCFSYPFWKRIFRSPAVRARRDVRQDPVEPELRKSRVA